ncbi:MAG: hypothetical protein IPK64_05975 [bacterium]|nr:hypothetical protein [bacterium]
MRWCLLLLLLGVGAGPALATDEGNPATVLALARLDSVAIAASGRVTGVAWLATDTLAVLVVADGAAGGAGSARLVLQDRRGRVLRSENVTGVLDRGLAWDGRSLWSIGDAGGGARLFRLEPALMSVAASYPTPGHRPGGVCHDGRFVWLVDRDSGRLERFDPSVLEITRSTAAPAFSPVGLAWDGRHLWLADAGTGRLYRLSGSRRAWSGTVAAEHFHFRGRAVHLTHDGQDLWFVPEDGRWLVRARIS